MAALQQYKCPCCDGAIEFSSGAQKMKCPYCDTEFELETLKGFDEDLKKETPDEFQWEDERREWEENEAEGLHVYVCDSCGGEVITDLTTAASKCPYCENPIVMKGQVAGDFKPDLVIPFKLDKKAAKEALKRHLSNKPLLPKVFSEENHIDEIKGVYVPFWVYDADANADMRYKATRVRTWNSANYRHIETSYFSVTRSGSLTFEKVPVDGSSKMADDLMESVEPYDFSEAVDFKTAYLSGYLAERYDVSAEDSRPRACERMKKSAEEAFRQTVTGYASVIPESGSVQVGRGTSKYVLYPVWILNTTWNGQKYVFAMNGQTGKFVGNLPTDGGLYRKYLFKYAAIIGAAAFAVQFVWNLIGG